MDETGRFDIGGPDGDSGLTGRKIIVDIYGGAVLHGGGAFSGKDPSKVDRSAAYAARYLAKDVVAAGLVTGASPAQNTLLVLAGPKLRFANGPTFACKFDGEFSGRSRIYAGTGTLSVRW